MLPQGDGHTPVILGEPGDEALLGAVTLEILGLVLNRVHIEQNAYYYSHYYGHYYGDQYQAPDSSRATPLTKQAAR